MGRMVSLEPWRIVQMRAVRTVCRIAKAGTRTAQLFNRKGGEWMPVNRDESGRFIKGNKSGGRKALPEEFKKAARDNALPALLVLIGIMTNEDADNSDRIKAANIIIERAYGKPTTEVVQTVSIENEALSKINEIMITLDEQANEAD